MKFKKPKFWDEKKSNKLSIILKPISYAFQLTKLLNTKKKFNSPKIKTICVGNIYLGGTGKTSLCIEINEILKKRGFKTCFIKKYYKDHADEQELLESKGVLFFKKNRKDALLKAIQNNFEIAIFDDGLQDNSIEYDIKLVCFNSINWIGNGQTIPSGPLRDNINTLKKYKHIFINGNLENLSKIKNDIIKINSNINIHIGEYTPKDIKNFDLEKNYLAFSGIGNHSTFISMLKKNKFKIIKDIEFADHHHYSQQNIDKIINDSQKLDCRIITTEKDFFRLKDSMKSKFEVIKAELKILDEKKLTNAILD